MYYYAYVDSDYICYEVIESEFPITDDPYCIQIDSLDKSLLYRKKYIDGVWEDTTPEEAQQMEGSHIGIFGEWLDVVINNKADIDHTHEGYANADHAHTEYASSNDLQVLEDVVSTKANSTHTHTEYSPSNHSHNDYATQTSLDSLSEEVEGKAEANHSHTEYALSSHEHDYASSNHNHDSDYASIGHNHNEDYSAIDHSHSNYATVASLDELSTIVSGKANATHNHNDLYYTENEIDSKLASKSDVYHNHNGVYDTSGSAASALSSANAYTDSKIDALVGEGASTTLDTIGEISSAIEDNQDAIDILNSAIANKANVADLNSHSNDTELHITEAERNNWNAKSNFSGNYNDLTNKPSIPSIDGLATEAYVDTQINAIDIPSALSELSADSTHRLVTDAEKAAWNAKSNFSGSYNDLTNKPAIPSISGLATETYVDEAVSTKANVGHTHGDIYYTENEVDSLLSGKANSAHNHNSSYDALGTAETKASAVQANLDVVSEDLAEHVDNDAIHFTAAERTKLSGIASNANNYTLPSAGSALGGVKTGGDVTISSGVITVNDDSHNHVISNVDGLQSALDGKASSSHNHDNTYYIQSQVDTKDSEILSSAQEYADGLNTTMNSRMNSVESKLDTVATNAEVNQNAFTNVVVGSTTIAADSKTDTLTIAAGTGVSITPDATNDKVTITNSGVRSIATGSTNGTISVNTNGTSTNVAVKGLGSAAYTNTSAYDAVGAADLALDSAKEYTDSVASGKANTSHTHTIANITNLQSTLDGKAATSHGTHVSYSTTAPVMDGTASVGTASTVARSDHKHPTDTSRAAQTSLDSHTSNKSNPHGVTLAQLGVTATAAELNKMDGVTATTAELNILDGVTATTDEINYVDGVTSNIQTQLNAKASSSHTHNYAGSSSVGGAATSANKLNTNAGSATQPVYFANGVPVATTYTLNKTVPSNAVFTDTTYSAATTSTAGLMSASDKSKLDGIASGANAYTLPTASSSTLGGVKTTSTVTSNSGYTACPIIGGVPYYKDTNTTYNLGSFGITATAAELNYTDGVTSNIQTQLNNKHTVGNNVTVEKSGSTPYVSLKVKDTSLETRIYKNANTTNDYGTIIQDYGSDGKRDALTLRRNTSLANKLTLKVQNADGTDVNYQIYGQHTPNLMSSNENGNCVIGWDNYDAGSGDTNIYGENVHIYARNADGSLPAGAVFVGRNSNNHTLINNAAHLDTANISDTYIYGRAVHIDTNDTNFIVDSIQLAHTDKSSISSYSSGWTYYGTASANTPTVRRYGKVVSLTGALTNTSAVTLNTTHVKVFTIPSGYRPSQDIIILCQGSGANEFVLQIKTDGGVYIGRYGTSSFSSIAAGQWFPFHVSWVME